MWQKRGCQANRSEQIRGDSGFSICKVPALYILVTHDSSVMNYGIEPGVVSDQLRFTHLGQIVGDVSQKMLTKTLRQIEADGLVTRTVFPVVPPRVEYELTHMGQSLGAAFCRVWHWAERNREAIEQARETYRLLSAAEKPRTESMVGRHLQMK